MEKLPTVYLETTIPSYLASRPAKDLVLAGEQLLTHEWWDHQRKRFHLYVSELVIDEAGSGDADAARRRLALIEDVEILTADDETKRLTRALIGSGLIPAKATADAVHVAIACRYELDLLLTWNCRHIANAQILRALSNVVHKNGYRLPVVCTPIELMGGGEDD
jgi:hypothetical protein